MAGYRNDVLIHSGGSGSKQGNDLGEEGRKIVRQYVDQGGFLGVCAGAYLATNDYSWSLNLLMPKYSTENTGHAVWGLCNWNYHLPDRSYFRFNDLDIYYGQGPLLARREWDDLKLSIMKVLRFMLRRLLHGAPSGIMKEPLPLFVASTGKEGLLLLRHPELTEGLHHLIPTVVNWLADDKTK